MKNSNLKFSTKNLIINSLKLQTMENTLLN